MNNRKQTELMLACTSRNENIVKILLMRYSKEEINLQDIFRRTALHYAVKSKSENAANRLIEAGADVNILDIDGLAPILLAAKTSQWNVLSRAVENIDSNLLLKSKNGESIAHFAASNSSIETLKKLKEKLVPLTELTEESESCLTLAATGGSIEVCEFLISEGNQVSHCNRKGENAICKAAKAKNSELFFHLATCHRADFLLKDENGNSSLYYFLDGSESLDHSAISELLLDVDEQNLIDLNSQGFGLCHMAAKKDSVKLLRELRDRGWDLSKTTASGETCITLAAKTSGSKALKFLLELSRNKDAMEPELSKSKQEQEKAFRICAELGKIELTDELFSRGVNVNATDEEGNTALMIACQHKQNDFALSLLSRESIPRVDVDVKNQNGFSALHFASKNQLTDCVEKLLSLGAKTDSGNSEGYTCLHEAVRGPDSTDVAELLIDSGCDVNQKTSSDETSLLLALKKGSKKLTKFLISRGARVDAEKVPISLVVKKFLSQGRREIITWLLKLEPKLDVNKVDADGRHVLFDVIDHGAEEILRLFISIGADIDCEDKRSVTPFLHALAVGREDLAKVLLERGCNTEKRAANGFDCVLAAVSTRRLFTLKWLFNHVSGLNSRPQAEIRGKNALHFCCQIGHPQMFKLLLENGFDLNKQCDIGWTPIDYAIAEGHLAIIKAADAIQNRTFLSRYEHHANTASDVPSPFAKAAANGYESIFKFLHSIGVNFEGIADTTIPFACGNGQQHIIKFLLSVGVDIEAYKNPKNGQTALLTAMYSGDLHLISFLVDKIRCDIRAVCHNRNTAIQGAVTTNQERILNYLISKGALIDEPDAEGDTPVLEAALLGHQRMLDILLDHNCNIKRLNNQARGAIHMAVIKNDNPEMLQFLIDKEIPANGRDEKGNTACMIASYQGHQKSVKLLLEHDRSLGKERNADGSTPALLAAMKGKHEVLQVLAENDCLEANDVDNDGSTILMMAIQSGSVPTVRMLLETGDCNTTAVNNNGIGVQTLATQCRDEAMLELLRQFGIEGQLAEAEATEAQQTSTVGRPIELLIFTPDTPEEQESEEDTDQQQEELEVSASEIFNDAASQRSRSTYRSTMHAVRHAPILVSDGNFMQEPEHANQTGSLISSHHPVSVAERASTVASANLSDIRHDSQSIAS